MKKNLLLLLFLFSLSMGTAIHAQKKVFPGAGESTPSKAQYFSWINNTNEGATEEQTQINLDFFGWLKSEYGMQLDIYAFDAGAIDGKRFYGSMQSKRFKKQFPYGFDSIYRKASGLGIRLGVWGGPDGFGNTPEEEQDRTNQMVSLCKDYNFALFKFDAVCGPLRPEKEDAFINMMQQCRKYTPDLILLNHRLGLDKAKPYATTFLWGGDETYIDVFMTNGVTAPHHRAAAISRGLVPGLKRLTEDHGVCLSSCLDNWDDDLILQAFNRSLILAPEIYGNPWLLRDDEFSKLARIYNLHRKYDTLLTTGMVLPEEKYGPYAISRGNGKTRIITLRNLSWTPVNYTTTLNSEIGLDSSNATYKLIQLHPNEEYLGKFDYNATSTVQVEPFRAAMFIVTANNYDEPLIEGVPFNLIQNIEDKPVVIDLVGDPGTTATIHLADFRNYASATINHKKANRLIKGKPLTVQFPGTKLKHPAHRKIADMKVTDIPADAKALYEATAFAADNNALEVRSLIRSGTTNIPEVKKARDAFFRQPTFVNRGVRDKNLFDSDKETGFAISHKYDIDLRIKRGSFRLNLGEPTNVDSMVIYVPNYFDLQPLLYQEGNYAEVSSDLVHWRTITYLADTVMVIAVNDKIQYVRLKYQPQNMVEIKGYYQGKLLNRTRWHASNLFAHSSRMHCVKSWKTTFTLDELANNSYLSVALNGKHGAEGAYVAAKIDGIPVGAPDRAPSYPSNTWEYVVAQRDANYTYYIPMKPEYVGKPIEVYVLAYDKSNTNIHPEVWISSKTNGKEKIRLMLTKTPLRHP